MGAGAGASVAPFSSRGTHALASPCARVVVSMSGRAASTRLRERWRVRVCTEQPRRERTVTRAVRRHDHLGPSCRVRSIQARHLGSRCALRAVRGSGVLSCANDMYGSHATGFVWHRWWWLSTSVRHVRQACCVEWHVYNTVTTQARVLRARLSPVRWPSSRAWCRLT